MKNERALFLMEKIDPELIEEAEKYKGTMKKKRVWIGAAAACLCLIVAETAGAGRIFRVGKNAVGDPPGTEEAAVAVDGSEDTFGAGVFIPAVELPEQTDGAAFDMVGLVVYKGGIYTQADSYTGEDAKRIEALVGDHLGRASGNIDEWSTQSDYAEELASSIGGEVYAVNGYGTDFRICIRDTVEDENGEKQPWILFLDRLNGITLEKGEDLFETRLHLSDRIAAIDVQSHADWNEGGNGLHAAKLDPALWQEFTAQVDDASFLDLWDPQAADPKIESKTVYDTDAQAHLRLTLTDGTVVWLRLIEGGYVGYDPLGWYFVKIDGETFDRVFAACRE